MFENLSNLTFVEKGEALVHITSFGVRAAQPRTSVLPHRFPPNNPPTVAFNFPRLRQGSPLTSHPFRPSPPFARSRSQLMTQSLEQNVESLFFQLSSISRFNVVDQAFVFEALNQDTGFLNIHILEGSLITAKSIETGLSTAIQLKLQSVENKFHQPRFTEVQPRAMTTQPDYGGGGLHTRKASFFSETGTPPAGKGMRARTPTHTLPSRPRHLPTHSLACFVQSLNLCARARVCVVLARLIHKIQQRDDGYGYTVLPSSREHLWPAGSEEEVKRWFLHFTGKPVAANQLLGGGCTEKVNTQWKVATSCSLARRCPPSARLPFHPSVRSSEQANGDGSVPVAAQQSEGQKEAEVPVPLDGEELGGLAGLPVRVVGAHESREPERAGQGEGHEEERGPWHHPVGEACRINAVAPQHHGAGQARDEVGAEPHGRRLLALAPVRLHLVVVTVEQDVRGGQAEQGGGPGDKWGRPRRELRRRGHRASAGGGLGQEEGARRQGPEGEGLSPELPRASSRVPPPAP